MEPIETRDSRTAALFGEDALYTLRQKRVAVFGLGGVGSWCAEALGRTGVGHLTIIDRDTISPSNLNRQLMALTGTVGRLKTDVMKERLLAVDPTLDVRALTVFYLPENAGDFDLTEFDCIIDAIDTVTAKLTLIERATAAGVPILSCMGTGNKIDPEQLCFTDIAKTDTCPLARVMRRELKKRGILHLPVVSSKEPPRAAHSVFGEAGTPASAVFVPASAGLLLASHAVRLLLGIE